MISSPVGTEHIAFDDGSETVRCASDVDEAEAGEIVPELKAEHAFPEVAS